MNPLQQLQLDIFGRLSATDYFSDVALYLIRPRSKQEALLLQTSIDNVLAGLEKKNGKSGVACRVEMPYVDVDKSEVPGPYMSIVATMRIIENPLINMATGGTGKSAEDVGAEVLSELHLWVPWGSGNIQRALFAEKRALDPVESLVAQGKVAYDASLKTHRGIPPVPRAAMPTISQSGDGITLASSTAGALIYYTLDETFPWAGNATATLYSGPFAITPPVTLRAVASAAGYQASNVLEADIT